MNSDYLQAQVERAVRDALVSGLASLRKAHPSQASFDDVAVVHEIAKSLLKYPAVNEAANVWEAFQTGYAPAGPGKDDEHPDNRNLLAVVWSLIGQGLIFPRLKSKTPDGQPHAIDTLVRTARGEWVTSGGDQHPQYPGFIPRFKVRAERHRRSALGTSASRKGQLILVPIYEQYRDWLRRESSKVNPRSPMLKAINYALSHWEGLTRFLSDGAQEWTSNRSERLLRHIVVGRKNRVFRGTQSGAEYACVRWSLIASCKELGVDPRKYLMDTIAALHSGESDVSAWTPRAYAARQNQLSQAA